VIGNPRAERRIAHALDAVARGAKLSAQLLAFGRRQPLEPKVVRIGRLIGGLDDMLRRSLGEAIEIETSIGGGLWDTLIDPTQLENALLNLAINARDAMEGQGRLTIEAGNATLDDEYARRHGEVTPGQYVMVAVTDTGSGMTPEIVEQAFEPFFSTKPEGKGTGLGLSMVYGFVKQSGGHIKIYSEPGHGTTIRLYLPRTSQVEEVVAEVEAAPAQGGTETILVVEDNEGVRDTVVAMLVELGYRVLKAKDGTGALNVLESGIRIDLLFTDVVMPGIMRGPELARHARERIPNLAVLFTSGYTENAIVHGGRLDPGVDLLSKPYTSDALARKLRQVLAGRDTAARSSATRETYPAHPKRSLQLLLVEDDVLIRDASAELLIGHGHAVAQASSAEAALDLLARNSFDVLVTDLGLPGLSGAALARLAARQQSGIGLVFATGAEGIGEELTDPFDHAVLLRKPYDEQGLLQAINAALPVASLSNPLPARSLR
jgi:CheY-like chemotaxis protein